MEYVAKASDVVRHFRETKLSTLKSPQEFVSSPAPVVRAVQGSELTEIQFDHRQISRPKDLGEATQRITYNTRAFSGNYLLVIGILAIYALITNYWLLIAFAFLAGGFVLINRFAPDPLQFGNQTITQRHLYGGLFVIGIPLLWFASPVSTFFWLVGSSAILILGHASLMETGVESEYEGIQGV